MKRDLEIHAARMRARVTERLRKTLWRKLDRQRQAGELTVAEVIQEQHDFWVRQESAVKLIRAGDVVRATPRRRSA